MKRATKLASPSRSPARLRCAIYTRKSSEEGLEQDFNSLHAQREACEAYVLSQVGEGWGAIATAYDDGGFSGGSMARPGLERLMVDVGAGRIDVVVVYKVDRLTRSLADFAKIVERFDARDVSFVSVTQAFNTTSSMGRLTLNVLLSFAQFEREVTGERIRDKIAQSKAKGMWMGGTTPLGYDTEGRALVVNSVEAEQVRQIFDRYLALGSVHALRDELNARGLVSKRRVSAAGRVTGGVPFERGALFHLLSNRHYLGEIVHKEQSFPGKHSAIIRREIFEAAQLKLAENAGSARRVKAGLVPHPPSTPLAGLVFDDRGNAMSSVGARKGKGRQYRYYVSSALQRGRREDAGSLPRFPGPALEELIRDRLSRLGVLRDCDDLAPAVERVEIAQGRVTVRLADGPNLRAHQLPTGDRLDRADGVATLVLSVTPNWRGGSKLVLGLNGAPAVDTPRVDLALLRGLVRAQGWRTKLLDQGMALDTLIEEERVNRSYAQRLLRLAFLAPDIKRAILEGRTPPGMTLYRLLQNDIPLAWADQRTH